MPIWEDLMVKFGSLDRLRPIYQCIPTKIHQQAHQWFPIGIHQLLHQWIERRIYKDQMAISLMPDQNSFDIQSEFVRDFLEQLQQQTQCMHLQVYQDYIQSIQKLDYLEKGILHKIISEILIYEQHICNSCGVHDIDREILLWKSQHYSNSQFIEQCINENMCGQMNDMECQNRIQNVILSSSIPTLEKILENIVTQHLSKWKRNHILSNEYAVFGSLGKLFATTAYKEFGPWQVDSNSNMGHPLEILDQVQIWFTAILSMATDLKTYIANLQKILPIVDQSNTIQNKINVLILDVLQSSFIVEKQPPQVMKTKAKISVTTRLLVGKSQLPSNLLPKVHAWIVTENSYSTQPNIDFDRLKSGTLSKHVGEFRDFKLPRAPKTNPQQYLCKFDQMQVSDIQRNRRDGHENVAEEKFVLVFQTTIQLFNKQFQIRTTSLPVVVSVHTSQEPQAWATILWFNEFSFNATETSPSSLAMAGDVSWGQLAHMLDFKFLLQTGRGLSPENLIYLYKKLFPTEAYDLNQRITRNKFCKDQLPERLFSFWDWFYAVMKLTDGHLRPFWVKGHIIGFISRIDAEQKLVNSEHGTFLLRFCDSLFGKKEEEHKNAGLSVVLNHPIEIMHTDPFTQKQFGMHELDVQIMNFANCTKLYPSIEKSTIFGKSYLKSKNKSGYKPFIIAIKNAFTPTKKSNPSSPQPTWNPPAFGALTINTPSPTYTSSPGYTPSPNSDPIDIDYYVNGLLDNQFVLEGVDLPDNQIDFENLSPTVSHNRLPPFSSFHANCA